VAETAAEAAVMESTAAKFEQVDESLRGMLSRLLGELEILQSHFKGRAGTSFNQVKQAYEANLKKLSAALNETAAGIRSSGKTYTSTDDESASRVGGINTSMNLPL
jgi:WXG100 family type VII secretion target